MTTPPRRILFRVEESPAFPRALWDRLKGEAARRGIRWIDALREAVEHYVRLHHDDQR